MKISFAAACLFGLATISTCADAAPARAAAARSAAPTTDSLIAACHPGRDNKRAGEPEGSQVEGARTVSAREAHCLMTGLGKNLTVIAAIGDERKLPGALAMKWAGSTDAAAGARLKETLALMGKGKPADPLLFYCHHATCSVSRHASKHAVDAGYRNVFWFRDGLRGWEAGGYAFDGEEGKDVAGRFARRLATCTSELHSTQDVIGLIAQYKPAIFNAEYPKVVKSFREDVRTCLSGVDADFGADKARKAEVARELARVNGVLDKQVPNARAALEADPRAYLVPLLDSISVDQVDAYLAGARTPTSLAAVCAPPSYQVPTSPAAVQRTQQTMNSYIDCLNKLKENTMRKPYSAEPFTPALNLVAFAEPYTCARSRRQNCVPDANWRKVATALSADKLRVLENAGLERAHLGKEILEAQARLENFKPLLMQAAMLFDDEEEEASNSGSDADEEEEEEEAPRRPSYSGYSYTPPPPPQAPLRRPSDVSARGMR